MAAALAAAGMTLGAAAWGTAASADSESDRPVELGVGAAERLQEDPLALSTTGTGQFKAHIDPKAGEITWELSYSGLEGNVLQAHIHLGGTAQSGGIAVFLCTNLGNGPGGYAAVPGPARNDRRDHRSGRRDRRPRGRE